MKKNPRRPSPANQRRAAGIKATPSGIAAELRADVDGRLKRLEDSCVVIDDTLLMLEEVSERCRLLELEVAALKTRGAGEVKYTPGTDDYSPEKIAEYVRDAKSVPKMEVIQLPPILISTLEVLEPYLSKMIGKQYLGHDVKANPRIGIARIRLTCAPLPSTPPKC